MVLVDTSVWIDHLRRGSPKLRRLLDGGLVLSHPFVLGEIACGNLKNRREILKALSALPLCEVLDSTEVLSFIESKGLYGRGIGWMDAHLLASARLSGCALWTFDRPLIAAAGRLGVAGH